MPLQEEHRSSRLRLGAATAVVAAAATAAANAAADAVVNLVDRQPRTPPWPPWEESRSAPTPEWILERIDLINFTRQGLARLKKRRVYKSHFVLKIAPNCSVKQNV